MGSYGVGATFGVVWESGEPGLGLLPAGGFDLSLVFPVGPAAMKSGLSKQENVAQFSLPTLPREAGTPQIYKQMSRINWVPLQNQTYLNGTLKVHISEFGSYRVFAPILTLPFDFGEVFVFPNPTKGGEIPTLHVEVGQADQVGYRVYDVSGDLVDEGRISDAPNVVNGKAAYEHALNSDRFKSGTYIGVVTGEKTGKDTIRKNFRFSVVK